MTVVRPDPIDTSTSAIGTTRRSPKRSMSAAANGAVRPKTTRLMVTAVDVGSRDQPNSPSTGSISTPVLDRKPAEAMRAPKVTAATHQARCTRRRTTGEGATGAAGTVR
ncbi:hypothetical protein GCM10025868_37060 [Angustibacter aerolatus]|uniref:Uncharacterized protein n=1 Tax=Angustibacter aerolatus TaxID=1162965 RepID=A0ABQ6JLM8_9ACTN|nr:hypothetical protein GCM10025868_37060 [Angustibacter aerolatus]